MKSKKRIERIKKLSRLLEGGFDGSIGSEFHSNILSDSSTDKESIFDELKYRHSKDIDLKSYLPYDSEGIDEDIHIYILDKRFFGSNSKEMMAAISAITYLFNAKRVDFNVSNQKIDGIRNSNPVNKKSQVLNKLKKIIDENNKLFKEITLDSKEDKELNFDDHNPKFLEELEVSKSLLLTESQTYYLEHLEKSIEKSEIPFMLYIYDPNSPEEVSVDAVKHDAMHILKDVVDLDRQVSRKMYPPYKSLGTAEHQTSHPLGYLYKYIYMSSRYSGQALAYIISKYSSTTVKSIPVGIEGVKKVKTNQAEDALSIFMKFLYSKVKNYENPNLFLSENWTTDSNHDILQSLIFSDFEKDEKVVDYRLPSAIRLVSMLEDEYGFKIDSDDIYEFYEKIEKVFKTLIKKLVNIRKQYLEKIYKKEKVKGYKPGYQLFRVYQDFIESIDSKIKESEEHEDKSSKNEKILIENPVKADGEVRRRLRFMSEGGDSIYAFIRISV